MTNNMPVLLNFCENSIICLGNWPTRTRLIFGINKFKSTGLVHNITHHSISFPGAFFSGQQRVSSCCGPDFENMVGEEAIRNFIHSI